MLTGRLVETVESPKAIMTSRRTLSHAVTLVDRICPRLSSRELRQVQQPIGFGRSSKLGGCALWLGWNQRRWHRREWRGDRCRRRPSGNHEHGWERRCRRFDVGWPTSTLKLARVWNHDIVRYDDGTIVVLWQARVANDSSSDPDKRMLSSRFDGTSWKTTYLVKGGPALFAEEPDYLGLAAAHPDDPHVIYVSTPFDPRDDQTRSTKREIWQGVTCDDGATFQWAPITQGSSVDNLRPIVPKWDAQHTALLWLRGTYNVGSTWSLKVVGTISTTEQSEASNPDERGGEEDEDCSTGADCLCGARGLRKHPRRSAASEPRAPGARERCQV